MPRICTVCAHPEREAIDKALLSGESSYALAARYSSIKRAAIERHKKANHMSKAMVQAQGAVEVARADNLLAELQRCFARVNLLFDACDRWLRDPDDPERYEIGPRSEDISVVYSFQEEDKRGKLVTIRKKAKLSTLLKQVNDHHGSDLDFELVETKHADPRYLVLKASERLESQLELIARLLGELKDQPTINILVASPEWVKVRTSVLCALQGFPEARRAVVEALVKNNAQ